MNFKENIEDIKFEIEYFWGERVDGYYSFIQGIKNLWKYKSLIWNDRWYDYSFLHNMLRFKLNDMEKSWAGAHYIGSSHEQEMLKELVEILDRIDNTDEFTEDDFNNIDSLYQEFGEKLFRIETIVKKDEDIKGGEYTTIGSNIRRLWD